MPGFGLRKYWPRRKSRATGTTTLVLVDVENLCISCFENYGRQLDFFKVKKWLEQKYGEVTIMAFGRFHEFSRNGLSFAIKAHLAAVPSLTMIDTSVADKARKEVSDMALLMHGVFGQFGLWRSRDRYHQLVIMSGDGIFVDLTIFTEKQLGLPTVVMAERKSLSKRYAEAGVETVPLDASRNDLLVFHDFGAIDRRLVETATRGFDGQSNRTNRLYTFSGLVQRVAKDMPDVPTEVIAIRLNEVIAKSWLGKFQREITHREPPFVTMVCLVDQLKEFKKSPS